MQLRVYVGLCHQQIEGQLKPVCYLWPGLTMRKLCFCDTYVCHFWFHSKPFGLYKWPTYGNSVVLWQL